MFAESGAAYHVDSVGTGTQLALQSAWISDCINNDAFLDQFPRLKMLVQFGRLHIHPFSTHLHYADLDVLF